MSETSKPVIGEIQFAELLAEVFTLEKVPRTDQALVKDLGFDSLSLAEMWVTLELLSGHEVDPSAMEQMVTVGDIYRFISQQVRAGASSNDTSAAAHGGF